MKNFLIAMLLAAAPYSAYAQIVEQPPQSGEPAQFRSKPVMCMDKNDLIENSKRNGLQPLVGAIGNSFDGQQSVFPAFFLVVYNQETGNYSFLEFHKDGWGCLLGGGRNHLIFDHAEIDNQLKWD